MLTRLGNEGKGRAKSMAMLTGGGAGTVIAGGVRRPFSGRLAAGFNSWRRWGEEQGVRGLQDPTAASNCSGVDSPAGMASDRKISARRGENLGVVVPRRVAGPWRSCGAANGGLGCGGAARGHGGAVLCSHGAGGEEAARVCGRRGEWMGCRAAAGGAKIEAGGDPGGSRSMVTPP